MSDTNVLPFKPTPQPQTLGAVRSNQYGLILANGKPLITTPTFAEAIAAVLEQTL